MISVFVEEICLWLYIHTGPGSARWWTNPSRGLLLKRGAGFCGVKGAGRGFYSVTHTVLPFTTGSPAPLSCETGCGEGTWILVCRLLVPTQVSLLSMEEDIDTRKINNSFLRDHSYATEGNASPTAFRRWGRAQVADR